MTEVDLLPLFLDINEDIDTQFQFWISITFAVLVASFVADERLSRIERRVITALYLCAATIILLRYGSAIAHQQAVLALFTANGLSQPAVPAVAGLLRFALFTFGSLVAALSVLFPKFSARRGPPT
jgi:Ca2+/Na+ antiporter